MFVNSISRCISNFNPKFSLTKIPEGGQGFDVLDFDYFLVEGSFGSDNLEIMNAR